jgi:hypothetical protein
LKLRSAELCITGKKQTWDGFSISVCVLCAWQKIISFRWNFVAFPASHFIGGVVGRSDARFACMLCVCRASSTTYWCWGDRQFYLVPSFASRLIFSSPAGLAFAPRSWHHEIFRHAWRAERFGLLYRHIYIQKIHQTRAHRDIYSRVRASLN